MALLISRVPEILLASIEPEQAWEESGGELQPTLASALLVGRAWQLDSANGLQPTGGSTLTNDPFWELDENNDLQPKA